MVFSDGFDAAAKAEAKAEAIRMIEEKVYTYGLICGLDVSSLPADWTPTEGVDYEEALKVLIDRLAWANTL